MSFAVIKIKLNRSRLRDLLLSEGSYEAYNYLHDALSWWEYHPFGNSEAFLDYVIDTYPGNPHVGDRMTLTGGMQTLIDALLKQTQETHNRSIAPLLNLNFEWHINV